MFGCVIYAYIVQVAKAVLLSLPEEWITCGHSSIKRRSRFYYGVSTNMKRMKFMSLSLKVSK